MFLVYLYWQERKKALAYYCFVKMSNYPVSLKGGLVLTTEMRDVKCLGSSTSTSSIYSINILTYVMQC